MGQPAGTTRKDLAAGRREPVARPVTVLVADHHAVFRAALSEVIAATPGFEQIAEAASCAEAVRLARALGPDLVLADERLPDEGGPALARRIAALSPRTVTVVLALDRRPEALGDDAVLAIKQELSPRALQRLWGRSRSGRAGRRR